MTGDQLERIRVIVSQRLISPISCCNDFNKKAVSFRLSQAESAKTERLVPDIAVKALDPISGTKKPTYEDTDNRKRDFTGDTRPGVETNSLGYRWEKARKWEPGSNISLFPSYASRYGMKSEPNFGWTDERENQPKSFEELLYKIRSKPGIQLTKYKVNPKTDDIIPESAKVIDSLAMVSGMTQEERRRKHSQLLSNKPEEKVLPGRPLSSWIPGGTLVARAAAAIGVIVDERNKFRCPPGTPAANQFTDAMGTNCFGFSASRFTRFAMRQAAKMTESDESGVWSKLGQTARNFFNFWYNDMWSLETRGKADPAFIERVAWWESVSGDRFKPPEWRNIPAPDDLRLFKNGMVRGQDDVLRQKADVRAMYTRYGIDPDDVNAPVLMLQELKREFDESGGRRGWDIQILNSSGVPGGDQFGRLLPDEVRGFVEARLMSTPGWMGLTEAEKLRIISSDERRYYETERALIETLLDQYLQNPEQARFIGQLRYNFMSDDEANTRVYMDGRKKVPMRNPDGSLVLDEDGEIVYGLTEKQMRGAIEINLGTIMANQETMLPNTGGDERLAIAAVGARSDAEARYAVADFMVNAEHTARGMAGLIDGVYSFSSHIMLHEFSHGIQAEVFMDLIDDQIKYKGFVDIPIFDRSGQVRGTRRITDIKQLTSDDLMSIWTQVADGIDIKSLGDALERIKDVAPIAGAYPREYVEGSELWALEVSAELWALRERGIIYGDDIDRALAWMDAIGPRRAATARALSDDDAAEEALDESFSPIPDGSPVPDMPEDEMEEALEEAAERGIAEAREELIAFRDALPDMEEEEIINEAAIAALQKDEATRILRLLEAESIDPSLPDDERTRMEAAKDRAIREARLGRDLYEAKYEEAKKAWRKKYGLGTRSDSARFDDEVRAIREREGMFGPDEIAAIAREAKLDDLRLSASRMSEKALIRKIADSEIKLKALDARSEEARNLSEEIDVLKSQYVKNLKEAGDSRTSAQIRRSLDSDIRAIVSPPPKKLKKFKDASEAKTHASKERKRLRASKIQKDALASLGDIAESDVGQLLDPVVQTRAGRAMNERNRRLKRLGLEIDSASVEQADMVQQIENILIPAMEAIDSSAISDPFEIETLIDFPDGSLRGSIDGKEIPVEKFVSGRVITRKTKKSDIPEKGIRNKETKTTTRRVILQVREGDRGIFPRAGEGEQKFVAPPGNIRIVGKDKDGTIRAEISYQKDTVQVLDSVSESIASNPGDKIWREGASSKIKHVVDRYVVKKREDGVDSPGPRSDYEETGLESSDSIVGEIIEAGGHFGEYDDDDADIPSGLIDSGDDTKLSSGASHFGGRQTRTQSTRGRRTKLSSGIRSIKRSLSGDDRGGEQYASTIDPAVARLIASTPEEELIKVIEDSAYRLHRGFDRRVRVRARDEDIERLASTGSIRSSARITQDSENVSRRTQRRVRSAAESGRAKLSSGKVSTFQELQERRKKEEGVAREAVEVFKRVAKNGTNIDQMDSDELDGLFGGKVQRSGRKSVSLKHPNIYETEDASVAIALMMLGHHVAIQNQDIQLTALAQEQFEKMVKQEAREHIELEHPKWLEFKSKFVRETGLSLDNEDNLAEAKRVYEETHQSDLCGLYDPEENILCSGNIGIDRGKMPQTNGRTLGHNTAAIRALKDGHAAGKWEPAKKMTDPGEEIKNKHAEAWAKAIQKKNDKLAKKGKEPLDKNGELQELHTVIGELHTVRNEWAKTQAQHRESDAFKSLTDAEKQWLYENTNWQDTEVNLESPFIAVLESVIKTDDGRPAVMRKTVDAKLYAPSQRQLVSSKVASTAQEMLDDATQIADKIRAKNQDISDDEFRKLFLEEIGQKWYSSPILATQDSYILDGHHRWGSIYVANRSLPEEMQIPLNVNEVQVDIIEGLTLGKAYQGVWGIKEANLGVETKWKAGPDGVASIKPMTQQDVENLTQETIDNIGTLVDDIYESGDFIEIGSVGLSNNPDYAARVKERQLSAMSRRPGKEARRRERELSESLFADMFIESPRETVGVNALSSGRRSSAPRQRGTVEQILPEETKTGGLSHTAFAREFYSSIGIPPTVDESLLPVSGYVVHRSHLDAKTKSIRSGDAGNLNPNAIFEIGDEDIVGDGLTALGDIEIVLKPSVSRRTAYGKGHALSSGHKPVLLNSRNKEDIADAIINSRGTMGDSRTTDSMISLLASSIDGDYSKINISRESTNDKFPSVGNGVRAGEMPHEPFEAQILGGFDIDEIEQINYPFSRLQSISQNEDISDTVNSETIAERLRAAGFSEEEIEYFYSIGGGKSFNTESMKMLRNYRAAQRIKRQYKDMGIPNVRIAHPSGIDIEDSRSHAKGIMPGMPVEKVISTAIMAEIVEQAQKVLKDMKKPGQPKVVARKGGLL